MKKFVTIAAGLALATTIGAGSAMADSLDAEFLGKLGDKTVAQPSYQDTRDGQRLIREGKDICVRLRQGTPVVATDKWGYEERMIQAAVAVYCPEFAATGRDFG